MADCLLDLVLRPGETELPPVQVLLTVVASLNTLAGGDEPGEIDGRVVPAEMVREVVRLLGPASRPGSSPPGDDEGPAEGGAAETTDESEPADGSPRPAWQQVEQEELARWWAEVERRVLADELGTGPEPLLDEETLIRTLSGTAQELPDHEFYDPSSTTTSSTTTSRPTGIVPRTGRPTATCTTTSRPTGPGRTTSRPTGNRLARMSSPPTRPVGPERRSSPAGGRMPTTPSTTRHAHCAESTRRCRTPGRWSAPPWPPTPRTRPAGRKPRGRFNEADDALAVLRACTGTQRERLADLLSATGGGGLVERPRIALTDAVTGALLALTDLPEMRRVGTCGARLCRRDPARCGHDLTGRPGLGPPGPTDGYRPSAPLDRWVRARDRRCRFPGCRRRVPRGGELDHHRPYPLGPTSAANLAGYCTGHHRGKHQAPGWRHELASDGTLTVTTPTGLIAVTAPAPY